MVKVEHIAKSFGTISALDDISFSAPDGGITSIAGANGAGKTTLLKILSGVLLPSNGTVSIDGIMAGDDPLRARALTGTVFEGAPLYPSMTVTEHLQFVAAMHGIQRKVANERMLNLIDACNLGTVTNRITGNLSRGFRQRTALAAALIHNPSLLILDEPTSGLDPVELSRFWELLRSFAAGHTIIVSTHSMHEIETHSALVVMMASGKIIESGTVRELCERSSASSLNDAFMYLVSRQGGIHGRK